MRMCRGRRALLRFVVALPLLTIHPSDAAAAGPAPAAGAVTAAESAVAASRVARVVVGSVHPAVRPELMLGRTDPDLPMQRIIVSLERRPGGRARLAAWLAEQQDPASPRFHRWLTPDEFGAEFGLSDADLARVTAWLTAQGFTIDEVARGRGWVNVSGTARQVEQAFQTEMHDYFIDGAVRHANAAAPTVPRALAGLVAGVVSLHDIPLPALGVRRPAPPASRAVPAAPADTSDGSRLLAPADLATIYDLHPLYAAGIDGTGQSIAIVGRTDIKLADVQAFRAWYGLPAIDPVFVHNGPDPGIPNEFDEGESDLDVEWAGSTAPHATVQLVISASTFASDGIALSAQYAVDQNVAPVVSTSYGSCEANLQSNGLTFYSDVWGQAAAQGITAVVAAGDSGAALCQPPTQGRGTTQAVSGLCSTPNNICVGGTEFNDTASPSTWWAPTVDPVTKGSALSYIPEVVWNESADVAGGTGLWATGGGASTFFAKPFWQVAPGVPKDGARDVPDVAMTAAKHTAYVYFEEGQQLSIGGTSGAAPAFAGIMLLVVQRARLRQGEANFYLYTMGNRQYSGKGPTVFHDITSGNNSVPGVPGFSAGPGYDQTTGLGTVDGTALADNWLNVSTAPVCVPSTTTLCIDDQQGDGRFSIEVSFFAAGQAGSGTAVSLAGTGLRQGGLFWFFAANNPELMIKVIDACQVNHQIWVFAAATTNVAFTVTVKDNVTGKSKQYTNPVGTAAVPIEDTAALPCS